MGSYRKRQKVLIIVLSFLMIGIIIATFLLFCHIRRIEVSGNVYLPDEEVVSWMTKDPYATNSVYVWYKYNSEKVKLHPNFDAVKVKIENPWTVKIQMDEKIPAGFLVHEDSLVFFSDEGKVLRMDRDYQEGVPLVEGLNTLETKLYEQISVEDEHIFEATLETLKGLKENNLSADKIVISESDVYVYMGNLCVNVGANNLEHRIRQIPPIQENLKERKGLLHLENYQNEGESIHFEIDIWPFEAEESPKT